MSDDERMFPTSQLGMVDAGAERDYRVRGCARTDVVCMLAVDHVGACEPMKREPYKRQAWDLRTKDPSGWAERRRSR